MNEKRMAKIKGFYPITSVHKGDLEEVFRNHKDKKRIYKVIDLMTEKDMEQLANYMAEDYLEQLYWSSMKIIFEDRFLNKR